MSEEKLVCAHCRKRIKGQDPMMRTTDANHNQVVIHTRCRAAFEKAKG